MNNGFTSKRIINFPVKIGANFEPFLDAPQKTLLSFQARLSLFEPIDKKTDRKRGISIRKKREKKSCQKWKLITVGSGRSISNRPFYNFFTPRSQKDFLTQSGPYQSMERKKIGVPFISFLWHNMSRWRMLPIILHRQKKNEEEKKRGMSDPCHNNSHRCCNFGMIQGFFFFASRVTKMQVQHAREKRVTNC